MKHVYANIFLVLCLHSNAQIHFVEDTSENENYYDCVGPCFLSCENNGLTYSLWNNSTQIKRIELNILDSISTNTDQMLLKFHRNGQISLLVRDYFVLNYSTDSNQVIIPTGYFQTYHSNGQLRSFYYVDKNGKRNGRYLFYQKNGKLLFENEYREGNLYSGIELHQNWVKLNEVNYKLYKKGILVEEYDICLTEKTVLNKLLGKRKYEKLASIIESFMVKNLLIFY
jgi:antitoxin component YwqK of YwqJK toxin-antitoxin module